MAEKTKKACFAGSFRTYTIPETLFKKLLQAELHDPELYYEMKKEIEKKYKGTEINHFFAE